jgi:hypothetical protein
MVSFLVFFVAFIVEFARGSFFFSSMSFPSSSSFSFVLREGNWSFYISFVACFVTLKMLVEFVSSNTDYTSFLVSTCVAFAQ